MILDPMFFQAVNAPQQPIQTARDPYAGFQPRRQAMALPELDRQPPMPSRSRDPVASQVVEATATPPETASLHDADDVAMYCNGLLQIDRTQRSEYRLPMRLCLRPDPSWPSCCLSVDFRRTRQSIHTGYL